MSLLTALSLLVVVSAVTCAVPGALLVVRHQSMLVDAVSHAVLPGIVVGALLAGRTRSPLMVAVAVGFGLLVLLSATWLRRSGLVTHEASQGLVFPALFALGVALLSTLARGVHLSESTVLAGELNLMALPSERWRVGEFDLGPQMVWWLLIVLALAVIVLVVSWRTLAVGAFDPTLAHTLGMPTRLVDHALMVLVTVTVVISFSAVGSVLVIALMVIPAATARLMTRRLPTMLAMTVIFAAGTSLLGLWIARAFDLATAPMMAFLDGTVFLAILAVRAIPARYVMIPRGRKPSRISSTTSGAGSTAESA